MRGIKRVKKGFSLIEVVISVAILVILMIPIASVTISTVQRNAEAEDRQRANFEGQKLLEELKSYDSMNLEIDERDPLNIIETASLLNEKPLNITNVTTDPTTLRREYMEFETDSYQINDGTGDLYAKVKLVRNPDATYKDVTPYEINGNYRQVLNFYSTQTAPLENSIALNIDTDGEPTRPETINISDINAVTVVDPTIILVLNIDEYLNIRLLKRTFASPAVPDEELDTAAVQGLAANDGSDKILIKLDERFNSSNVNLYVESLYAHALTFDIFKENNPTNKVEIKTAIVNPITGRSRTQTAGAINVTNNVSTYRQTKIGDLYTITVEIMKRSSRKVLFTGDAIKNIELNKTEIR